MLDSANAQTVEFVERFKKQRGDDPTRSTWVVVQAYDAGQLAVAAVRKAVQIRRGPACRHAAGGRR